MGAKEEAAPTSPPVTRRKTCRSELENDESYRLEEGDDGKKMAKDSTRAASQTRAYLSDSVGVVSFGGHLDNSE